MGILLERIDSIGFDIVANELNYDEYTTLSDAYQNLKYSEAKALRNLWTQSFSNQNIRGAFEYSETILTQYPEAEAAKYDPLKPRVIGGVTESLVKANLKDLHVMQNNETEGLYKGMFPYAPDVLMGYQGKKVGLFVLNQDEVMRDSQKPTGFQQGKMRLVESAHRLADKTGASALRSVGLPVTSVVDADIKNMRLSLREDFKIGQFLDESVLGTGTHKPTSFNTECLAQFSTNLV